MTRFQIHVQVHASRFPSFGKKSRLHDKAEWLYEREVALLYKQRRQQHWKLSVRTYNSESLSCGGALTVAGGHAAKVLIAVAS